ncbi:LPXTG cell wall anchor domain-containing protein [uncultured Enterococcus sp.]|uniref:right-handed parallel beta-helix repeat-containing protein n=1 Tax=uncultured Enterococcus sp. TaxID=167972 RepID=UPI002AA758AE|nr:LPXTG cell wall anchor domain-containing protein [uncultured Enterococcus sp.]
MAGKFIRKFVTVSYCAASLTLPLTAVAVEATEMTENSFSEENVHVNNVEATTFDSEIAESKSIEAAASEEVEHSTAASVSETEAEEIETAVAPRALGEWQSIFFGESTGEAKTSINVIDEKTVNIKSQDNGGKFLISGTDGLSYYYTQVPKDKNFSLSGKVTVNTWKYTNGQEGFALMVRDAVPTETMYDRSHYSNSYSILGSRLEYIWDFDKNQVTTGNGTKYAMKLGLGTRTVVGVTSDPLNPPEVGSVTYNYFPLETAAADNKLEAGTYNVMGNAESEVGATTIGHLTTFDFTMKKTNSGFEAYYTDASGKTVRDVLWDWESMFVLDQENVCVGFATARNMDITVSGLEMTYSDPKEDPDPEERPTEKIEPVYSISSSKESGTKEYDLRFKANADGSLVLRDKETGTVFEAGNNVAVQANKEITIPVELAKAATTFEAIFTPDKTYTPGEYMEMSNYDEATIEHQVKYRELKSTLYVTPGGAENASGTVENPIALRTALSYAKPGMTIVLAVGNYTFDKKLTIQKGVNGTAEQPITLVAEKNEAGLRPVLDFTGKGGGLSHWGNYWIYRGFDVTGASDMSKGIEVSGHYNWLEDIQTYRNGNTGIQISGSATDTINEWPSYNTIKNCTSYENADTGFEDADGFAAKITTGPGNVFDGCIAYHNADDGWDLFAKNETGSIGKVTIKNSVAYRNGWLANDPSKTGNGNGFKMGGSSLPGDHELINSLTFENLGKGIDSNSGTDIIVNSSTSFNNQSHNVALYTTSSDTTNYFADGILSFRTTGAEVKEKLELRNQEESQVYGATNYYWTPVTGRQSVNTGNHQVQEAWFERVTTAEESNLPAEQPITRYSNGSINVHGLMQVKNYSNETLAEGIGAVFNEMTSPNSAYPVYDLSGTGETEDSSDTSTSTESSTAETDSVSHSGSSTDKPTGGSKPDGSGLPQTGEFKSMMLGAAGMLVLFGSAVMYGAKKKRQA